MKTAVMPLAFDFEGQAVRTINRNGVVWWVLSDVCAVLDIRKHRDAASRLDNDERGSVLVDTHGGPQEVTAINESGIYSLALTSRKAAAKRFKKWVTQEVLPALRRTGTYSIGIQPDISHVLGVAEAAILTSQNAVRVLTPKAQAYHSLTCMDGLHTLTDAAKLCGQTRNQFLSKLEVLSWIYRPGGKGCWSAKADKIKAGYLTHKYCDIRDADGQLKTRSQVVVTDRGVAKLKIILARLENTMLAGDAA
ncbi:BRO family protein [Acetobacter pasteurianus]